MAAPQRTSLIKLHKLPSLQNLEMNKRESRQAEHNNSYKVLETDDSVKVLPSKMFGNESFMVESSAGRRTAEMSKGERIPKGWQGKDQLQQKPVMKVYPNDFIAIVETKNIARKEQLEPFADTLKKLTA